MADPGYERGSKNGSKTMSVFGASSAALRKVIANPLKGLKRQRSDPDFGFNAIAKSDPASQVLEKEIIPRLLMAHAAGATQTAPTGATDTGLKNAIDPSDTERFANLPLRVEAAGLLEEVERFLDRGVSVEAIYIDLLGPAARKLGELWENDRCDFVDVTMGLWRLQEVMRDISLRFPPEIKKSGEPRSAVFCPIPGDVHSFGAQMIEEVFARAGWQSDILLQPERRELLDYLARRPVDLVGLPVSRACPSSALASLIKAIRSVAVNPQLSIIIGGNTIMKNPDIVSEVGADGTGADAREALVLAERLVSQAAVRAHSLY